MVQKDYERFVAEEENKKLLEHSEAIDKFIVHFNQYELSLRAKVFYQLYRLA